jgi:SNF2 family DNA or RNA helicase
VVASRTADASTRSQADLDALLDSVSADTSSLVPFDAATAAPALRTPLHDFQAAGVAWMLRRERDPDGGASGGGLPPFWSRVVEKGTTAFLNAITNSSSTTPPSPVAGGLLADDMGLGKSLQVLALILANVRFCVLRCAVVHRFRVLIAFFFFSFSFFVCAACAGCGVSWRW